MDLNVANHANVQSLVLLVKKPNQLVFYLVLACWDRPFGQVYVLLLSSYTWPSRTFSSAESNFLFSFCK